MSEPKRYEQYCPIAVTAEILCRRWTPLVLRAFFCGATRYSDIQKSVPSMSSALLSSRIKELEYAGVIERIDGKQKAHQLTKAGRELFPILEQMGVWSQSWLRQEITLDRNLDPDVFMWELRQTAVMSEEKVSKRRTALFQLSGVQPRKQRYWIVFEEQDTEICVKDPGYEVDIWITAHIRTLVEIWLGHKSITQALDDSSLQLDGSPSEIREFPKWFALSPFGKIEQKKIQST